VVLQKCPIFAIHYDRVRCVYLFDSQTVKPDFVGRNNGNLLVKKLIDNVTTKENKV
jgi:hypothetical protein